MSRGRRQKTEALIAVAAAAVITAALSALEPRWFSAWAAAHDSAGTVYWGVAVDDGAMYRQLTNQIVSDMHAMYLHDGAEKERANHERLMNYYQQMADRQLREYVGQPRETRMKLTRIGVGSYS